MTSEIAFLRDSTPADVPELTRIYAWHVLNGTGTFETEVPTEADMAGRREAIVAQGLPWLVAEAGGRVLGYAYAGQFRPRGAYRFCLEDSVYLDDAARGRGIGRLLLTELLARCEARGTRQVLALIGDSANLASIGLHRALGFEHTGVLRASGWKLGAWRDVVIMQRALGPSDSLPPPEDA